MNNLKCPRCTGKMYAEIGYQDEAYCMICGYVEYMDNHKCPRCSGKMYIDPDYQDEAYCMACGYVEYSEKVST